MKLKCLKDVLGNEKERDTLALICPSSGYPNWEFCTVGTKAAMFGALVQLCEKFAGLNGAQSLKIQAWRSEPYQAKGE